MRRTLLQQHRSVHPVSAKSRSRRLGKRRTGIACVVLLTCIVLGIAHSGILSNSITYRSKATTTKRLGADGAESFSLFDFFCASPKAGVANQPVHVPSSLFMVLGRALEDNLKASSTGPIHHVPYSTPHMDEIAAQVVSDTRLSMECFQLMASQRTNMEEYPFRPLVVVIVGLSSNTQQQYRVVDVTARLGGRGDVIQGTVRTDQHWCIQSLIQLRRALFRLRATTVSANDHPTCIHSYLSHGGVVVESSTFNTSIVERWLQLLVEQEIRFLDNHTAGDVIQSCPDELRHAKNFWENDHNVSSWEVGRQVSGCAAYQQGDNPGPPQWMEYTGVAMASAIPYVASNVSRIRNSITKTPFSPPWITIGIALDENQVSPSHQLDLVGGLITAICALRNNSAEEWRWNERTKLEENSALRIDCNGGAMQLRSEIMKSQGISIQVWGRGRRRADGDERRLATLEIIKNANYFSATSATFREAMNETYDVLMMSLNAHTVVKLCGQFNPKACTVGVHKQRLIVIVPGPLVPQTERAGIERIITECLVLSGCAAPAITWFRPAEDEVLRPGLFDPAEVDQIRSLKGQHLKMLSKDIQELAVETVLHAKVLFPLWEVNTQQPESSADRRPHVLGRRVIRWSERTLYDPDWFHFPLPSMWVLQPIATLATRAEVFSAGSPVLELVNKTRLEGKGPRTNFIWSLLLPGDEAMQYGFVTATHHLRRMNETAMIKQLVTKTPLSAAEKKQRKRQKMLGADVGTRARFGWHTENTDAMTDLMAIENTSLVSLAVMNISAFLRPSPATQLPNASHRWTTYFHYPWVRDNLYHLHNDNIFPLLLSIHREEHASRTSTSQQCRRLVLLPSTRTQVPLPFAEDLFRLIFDEVVVLLPEKGRGNITPRAVVLSGLRDGALDCDSAPSSLEGSSTFVFAGPLVFGRPPRPFSTEMRNVAPYITHRIVHVWRDLVWHHAQKEASRHGIGRSDAAVLHSFGNVDIFMTPNDRERRRLKSEKVQELFVTWITRRGTRTLDTDGALLGWISATSQADVLRSRFGCSNCILRVQVCCEGLSFWEQVQMMRRTNILLGVHGAGLLHTVFVDTSPRHWKTKLGVVHATPLVVHIGSAHMNYHEQTVIERLTKFASVNETHRVRFHSTFTSPIPKKNRAASWRDGFHIGSSALQRLFDHALWLYFLA